MPWIRRGVFSSLHQQVTARDQMSNGQSIPLELHAQIVLLHSTICIPLELHVQIVLLHSTIFV
jgi:hypothetical protein